MKSKIIEALNEIGCLIETYSDDDKLSEYIVDSLSLISFIVNIEEKFECEIDAELLTKTLYEKSMKDFEQIIKSSI